MGMDTDKLMRVVKKLGLFRERESRYYTLVFKKENDYDKKTLDYSVFGVCVIYASMHPQPYPLVHPFVNKMNVIEELV